MEKEIQEKISTIKNSFLEYFEREFPSNTFIVDILEDKDLRFKVNEKTIIAEIHFIYFINPLQGYWKSFERTILHKVIVI